MISIFRYVTKFVMKSPASEFRCRGINQKKDYNIRTRRKFEIENIYLSLYCYVTT